jgi:hypothetical protein
MDVDSIGTGLTILGASELTKDSVKRILAPTADYIGVGVLSSTKASVNLARVLMKAVRKVGPSHEGKRIPPRVLKAVLDEAPFVEDELAAEYYGGIVAASFSDGERDDRGVAILATVQRLSCYSLSLHYMSYRCLCAIADTSADSARWSDRAIFVPMDSYDDWMRFGDATESSQAMAHAVLSLERENMIRVPLSGGADWLKDTSCARKLRKAGWSWPRVGGIIADGTLHGWELFSWAHGYKDYLPRDFDAFAADVANDELPTPLRYESVPVVWSRPTR